VSSLSLLHPVRSWPAAAALLLAPLAGQAQVEAWLRWSHPDLPGSVQGWVRVLGLDQGLSATLGDAGGGSANPGQVELSAAALTFEGSALLPAMVGALTSGQHLDQISLQFAMPDSGRDKTRVLIELVWQDAQIISAQLGLAHGSTPAFSVGLVALRAFVRTTVIEPSGDSSSYLEFSLDQATRLSALATRSGSLIPGAYAGPGDDDLPPDGDADGDGIPNGWELEFGLDPRNPNDAHEDPDGDGLSNFQEYLAGTHPLIRESVLAANLVEVDGVYRFELSVGYGRRVELRHAESPPADRNSDGTVLDVIEFTTGDGDDLVVPIPAGAKGFYWIVVTLPTTF